MCAQRAVGLDNRDYGICANYLLSFRTYPGTHAGVLRLKLGFSGQPLICRAKVPRTQIRTKSAEVGDGRTARSWPARRPLHTKAKPYRTLELV